MSKWVGSKKDDSEDFTDLKRWNGGEFTTRWNGSSNKFGRWTGEKPNRWYPRKADRSQSFKEIWRFFKTKGACAEGVDWFDDMVKNNPKITFGEAMDTFLGSSEARESWSIWAFEMMGDDCDSTTREEMLSKVQDPMKSLKLYKKHRNTLSSAEKTILKSKFQGKLPNAEGELGE